MFFLLKKKTRQGDLTFQDIHGNKDFFDEDDEDDSDWEPVQKHVELIKWFCINCTMLILAMVLSVMYVSCHILVVYYALLTLESISGPTYFCDMVCVWMTCTINSVQLCGEHKDSGILRLGYFASPSSQDTGCSEVESEMKGKNKGDYMYLFFIANCSYSYCKYFLITPSFSPFNHE